MNAPRVLVLASALAAVVGATSAASAATDQPGYHHRKRNVNVSAKAASQNEATVAVNPLDASDILIASNDVSGSNEPVAYESLDGGRSWTVQAIAIAGTCADPWLHFDDAGDAFFSYLCFINGQITLGYAYRLHGAGAWTATTFTPALTGGLPDRDMVTSDDTPASPYHGSVYIGYTSDATNTAYVLYSRNGTTGWTRSGAINDASSAIGVNVAVAPDGSVHATWLDWPRGRIMTDTSTDGGATWGTDHRVVRLNTDTSNVFVSIPPQQDRGIVLMPFSVASPAGTAHAGRLYVTYEDTNASGGPDTNVYVTHSRDGSIWSKPVQVDDDGTGAYQFFPAIAVAPNGTVGLSFYDTRNDPANHMTDQYVSFSADGGRTWSPNARVTTAPSDETGPHDPNQYGDYEGLAASPTNAFVDAWTDSRPGNLNEDLFFARVKAPW